jgi:hypothetical protein
MGIKKETSDSTLRARKAKQQSASIHDQEEIQSLTAPQKRTPVKYTPKSGIQSTCHAMKEEDLWILHAN